MRSVVCLTALHLTFGTAAGARDLELPRTGEAATAQPMVVLSFGDRPRAAGPAKKTGNLENLLDELGDLPAVAILDTGASGHVLSHGTAARFDVKPETGARYYEAGMSGAHAMGVSRPISLGVEDFDPTLEEDTRTRRATGPPFRLSAQRLLMNDAPADPRALLLSPGAMVDVVGMPLIRERVVEIAPSPDAGSALAVRLHPSAAGLRVDVWVPLTLVDFNRRDPRNRGATPTLTTNPIVAGVTTELGTAEAEGDWLLDTGAACTMISTATARALGLFDADGKPTRRPEFTLPVGGVGGGHTNLPGFRLDRLSVTAEGDRTLVFPGAAVVVHDVATIGTDGTKVVLDGILGMNLLLPSGDGMTMLGAATQLPSPFERIVIDVAGDRLGLAVARR